MTMVVRDGWRRLRGVGLRRWVRLESDTLRQIAKTALAATVSWELAIRLLDSPLPALAALGAILTVQVTIKQTISFGVQQVVGVTVGVGAAVVGVLGVHTWSVGLVILCAWSSGTCWPTRWSRPAPRWPRSAGCRPAAAPPTSCTAPTTPR